MTPSRRIAAAALGASLLPIAPWIWSYKLDTDVYRHGALAVIGTEALYSGPFAVGDTALPFTYPPFAALVFLPLAWLPIHGAGLVMTALSLISLFVLLRAGYQASGVARAGRWASISMPAATLMEPVRDTISFGQVNLILAAMVVLGVRRPWLVGVAAAIKLTPGIFGLFFLIRRRGVLSMLLGFCAATAAAVCVLPTASREYFIDVLFRTERIGDSLYPTNQSLTALGLSGTPWVLAVAFVLALGVVAAFRLRQNPLWCLLIVALTGLVCSPISWSHHWVWWPVVVIACLGSGLYVPAGVITVITWLPPHALGIDVESYLCAAVALIVSAAVWPQKFSPRNAAGSSGTQQSNGSAAASSPSPQPGP